MNIIDIVIIAVIAVSVLFGLHRGFISGLLSLAALVGSTAFAFATGAQLAATLNANETLVRTLMYYTDAGNRISNLDQALMTVSQVTTSALREIVTAAQLPAPFEAAFLEKFAQADGGLSVSGLLSSTIVSVSISVLSFLICFSLAYVVLTFFIHLISYVFELPILRHLDSLLGGAFGFARGVLLVVIFFALVPLVEAVVPLEQLQELIADSRLAGVFSSELVTAILRV